MEANIHLRSQLENQEGKMQMPKFQKLELSKEMRFNTLSLLQRTPTSI